MIIRAVHNKENPYFQMRRRTAQDERLTWDARGILSYLFSKPTTWTLSVEDLIQQTKQSRKPLGRDGVLNVLKELEENKYLYRHQMRRKDGALGQWISDVYEEPFSENPQPAEPEPAEPEPAKPVHREYRKEKREIAEITEQQASSKNGESLPAAAFNLAEPFDDYHLSRFHFTEVETFVASTKPHIKNPGALARILWRNGIEDEAIERWQEDLKEAEALKERIAAAAAKEEASQSDWDQDQYIDDLIARGDKFGLAQLENEREGIIERGGPELDWEHRVIAHFINLAASEAAVNKEITSERETFDGERKGRDSETEADNAI